MYTDSQKGLDALLEHRSYLRDCTQGLIDKANELADKREYFKLKQATRILKENEKQIKAFSLVIEWIERKKGSGARSSSTVFPPELREQIDYAFDRYFAAMNGDN